MIQATSDLKDAIANFESEEYNVSEFKNVKRQFMKLKQIMEPSTPICLFPLDGNDFVLENLESQLEELMPNETFFKARSINDIPANTKKCFLVNNGGRRIQTIYDSYATETVPAIRQRVSSVAVLNLHTMARVESGTVKEFMGMPVLNLLSKPSFGGKPSADFLPSTFPQISEHNKKAVSNFTWTTSSINTKCFVCMKNPGIFSSYSDRSTLYCSEKCFKQK